MIDEEVLIGIIEPKADIEEISSVSSDGRNLLTRIPKRIVEELKLKKGDSLRWLVNENKNNITLEVVNENEG